MKDETLNALTDNMWEMLLSMNGTSIALKTKSFPAINNGVPMEFIIEGVFSGEKKTYEISGGEICSKKVSTVKLSLKDIAQTEIEVSMGSNSLLKRYALPQKNLKNFIESVIVSEIEYKIDEERINGLNQLLILKLTRS